MALPIIIEDWLGGLVVEGNRVEYKNTGAMGTGSTAPSDLCLSGISSYTL